VNFLRGKRTRMHHIAFEVRDFSAVEQGCDVLSSLEGCGPIGAVTLRGSALCAELLRVTIQSSECA
jgi:hypothetical protein